MKKAEIVNFFWTNIEKTSEKFTAYHKTEQKDSVPSLNDSLNNANEDAEDIGKETKRKMEEGIGDENRGFVMFVFFVTAFFV